MGVNRQAFLLRRLHSLSGVFPIGAYLTFHIMIANASVLGGPESFDRAVAAIAVLPPPILLAVEVLFIYVPILFHGLYGFVRVRDAELDRVRGDDLSSSLYVLQRLTGVIAFFFILFHAWTTRGQHYFGNVEIGYPFMRATLANPLVLTIYLVGALASVFHFTNGLWTFCITWGITVRVEAQRVARAASLALFVVMAGTVVAILMAFRA